MINEKDNPEDWIQLLFELEDAQEHLVDLIKKMRNQGTIDTEDYAVDIGHVFAHLNRAWNSRDKMGDISGSQYSQFPEDLNPVG